MTHETSLQKKKCFLVERHKSGCCLSNPSSKHAWNTQQTSNPVEGLRDLPRCSPRPDFVKLFLPRQRPFWAFTMDSRRELLQTLLPLSHPTTFPKFIRRQSVVTLLVAFLLLRWAGEGSFCFLVLYCKLLKVGLVDPRSLDLQGLEAFAGLSRSLGSGLVNDVATRQETGNTFIKHLQQMFTNSTRQQWVAASKSL